MREIITNDNIFGLPKNTNDAVCVTTNGMVKNNGYAVMGAGIAKQANQLFNCSYKLGSLLSKHGNHVFNLGLVRAYGITYRLFTFPTKHDWRNNSDLKLITQSAHELVHFCNCFNIQTCYLPPVGCGLGNLDWETQVKPILSPILDDRFIVILRP